MENPTVRKWYKICKAGPPHLPSQGNMNYYVFAHHYHYYSLSETAKRITFRSDFRKHRHRITFTFDIFTFKIVLPGDKAACKISCFRNINIRLAILNKMEVQMFIFYTAERGK